MAMSTYVVGFRPPDERWNQMKAVYDACGDAGVDPPEEVSRFFAWADPDSGIEVDLGEAARVFQTENTSGFEVILDKLPLDLKFIRFINSC